MDGPRGTKKEEFPAVMDLVNSVFRPEKKSMEKEYAVIFNESNYENLRIIIENGKPVCHIGMRLREIKICGCKSKAGSIGGVCTDPAYRKKGYSTTLLNDCIKKMDEEGCDFMLVSGDRGLYDRADCMRAGKVCRWTVRGDLERFKVSGLSIRDFSRDAVPDMIKAYNAKPVRFIRTAEDWECGFTCGQVMNRPCVFVPVYENEKFSGYLIIFIFDEGTNKVGEVMEYAGPAKSLLGSISLLYQKFNLARLSFNVPFYDEKLNRLMREKNFNVEVTPAHGTIRILNFTRLMQRMAPYFKKRIGRIADSIRFSEKNGKFIFELGKEKLVLPDRRILTWSVLGTPEGYPITNIGGLADLLSRIFPMPIPWPGLNYV